MGHNATTADGAITLEHAECLGNCEGAPVVTVDYFNYECVTVEQAGELVDRLVAGEAPPPTRGPTPPGVRAVEYRLAGLGPLDPAHQERAAIVCTASQDPPPRPESGPGPDDEALHTTPAPDSGDTDTDTDESQAADEVADAGMDPDTVESQSSYSSREFPTNDDDAAEKYPPHDPRGEGDRADG